MTNTANPQATNNESGGPIYNMKAVVALTGVPADTLRAWEKRYGIVQPYRSSTGRRLYSNSDLHTIRWLQQKTRQGFSISQAGKLHQQQMELGMPLAAEAPPRSIDRLTVELLTALEHYDEPATVALIQEAAALYPIETVCLDLLRNLLVEVGDRWYRGAIPIGVEHFATGLINRWIQNLMAISPIWPRGRRAITACLPGEHHTVGLAMVALFLQRAGWAVIHLGANTPIDTIADACHKLGGQVLCLSANSDETIQSIHDLPAALAARHADPVVVVGGQAVSTIDPATLPSSVHAIPGKAPDVGALLDQLLRTRNVSRQEATD